MSNTTKTADLRKRQDKLDAHDVFGTATKDEYEQLADDAIAHAERLEEENKRLREAHGAWVDGYDQAMHDADSVYIAQLDERDEEIARLLQEIGRPATSMKAKKSVRTPGG